MIFSFWAAQPCRLISAPPEKAAQSFWQALEEASGHTAATVQATAPSETALGKSVEQGLQKSAPFFEGPVRITTEKREAGYQMVQVFSEAPTERRSFTGYYRYLPEAGGWRLISLREESDAREYERKDIPWGLRDHTHLNVSAQQVFFPPPLEKARALQTALGEELTLVPRLEARVAYLDPVTQKTGETSRLTIVAPGLGFSDTQEIVALASAWLEKENWNELPSRRQNAVGGQRLTFARGPEFIDLDILWSVRNGEQAMIPEGRDPGLDRFIPRTLVLYTIEIYYGLVKNVNAQRAMRGDEQNLLSILKLPEVPVTDCLEPDAEDADSPES